MGPEVRSVSRYRCRVISLESATMRSTKARWPPDARIEYENEQGSPGRVDVEVTSDNYRSKSLQAKISAGFKLYANGSASQRRISSALGLNESKSGAGGRGGANRDEELFEL